MSFTEINVKDNSIQEGPSTIILCNFLGKELAKIKNFTSIFGIKNQIIVDYKNSTTLIKDILLNNLSEDGEGKKSKAIIFNNVSPAKLNLYIENLKKLKIQKPLIATVTDTSKEWTLDILIDNLLAEREALKKGDYKKH